MRISDNPDHLSPPHPPVIPPSPPCLAILPSCPMLYIYSLLVCLRKKKRENYFLCCTANVKRVGQYISIRVGLN